MRAAGALAAALAVGCGYSGARAPQRASEELVEAERLPAAARYAPPALPARESLPCFKCHDFAKFGDGGRFPHDFKPHKRVGHCHRCHLGIAHHGTALDTQVCKTCHEELPEGFAPRP
jgi:hypothetical protein